MKSLKTPRRILLSIPSGKPVDSTLEALVPLLSPGDIVVDGGNEFFPNTNRRFDAMAEYDRPPPASASCVSCRVRSDSDRTGGAFCRKGIHFVGMGISGGADGARHGPALMPGCSDEAWERLQPVLTAMAAKTDAGDVC